MLTEAEVASVACSREPAVEARPVRPTGPGANALREGAAATGGPAGRTSPFFFSREEGVEEQAGLFSCLLRHPDLHGLDPSILHANEWLDWTDNFEFLMEVSWASRGWAGARTLNAARMWGIV